MKRLGLLLAVGVLLTALSGCYARVTTYSYHPAYYHQPYYGGHYYKPHRGYYGSRGHYRPRYYRKHY